MLGAGQKLLQQPLARCGRLSNLAVTFSGGGTAYGRWWWAGMGFLGRCGAEGQPSRPWAWRSWLSLRWDWDGRQPSVPLGGTAGRA